MTSRRSFLKAGLVGGALLTAVGVGSMFVGRDPLADRRTVLAGLLPVLLAGALPAEPEARTAALGRALRDVIAAIEGLPVHAQAELRQLFLLLATPAGRWLAGVTAPWDRATETEISQALQGWRVHRLALMQTAYHALHDLALGAWYADPGSWQAIGYPGPPAL